ncbi:ABC transporter-like protein [Calderihabitans maritimus]|uniref:ABC transporter-like protein n=2 Tax=Calderihabitans maritimus TaxID=1246530 RepID=A0A1Z5HNR7_9FIRM|nr:ABC transporter-like protein [Calderihabitans maritimus]
MFELRKVRYKNVLFIDELAIPPRKVTCIVGGSGSGKTTLLKLLNHMISCDSGDVFFEGRNVRELDPVKLRRRVVMLPQNPTIFPGTIKDNLIQGFIFSEIPVAPDEELRKALQMVKLDKELHVAAADLSGGEKQRLALARILLLEPEVLLLDEPSSALDEETEEHVIKRLVEYVKSGGRTLIMVTHSKQMAQNYGEYIVTLEEGRVVKVGVNTAAGTLA